MTDPEIVSLYRKRDESAIKHTQSKYNAYLTRISYNILANLEDCREAVNDTYLAAWNSMPGNRPGVLSTYLGKITRPHVPRAGTPGSGPCPGYSFLLCFAIAFSLAAWLLSACNFLYSS